MQCVNMLIINHSASPRLGGENKKQLVRQPIIDFLQANSQFASKTSYSTMKS
jgi:hypothetical protein